jgi:ABC-2 type transport system permease protein
VSATRTAAEALEADRLGRPVQGPTALGSDLRRFWHLTSTLAVTEFKLRFFGSVLGYLWSVMRPLMLFGVLYVVFTQFVKVGSDAPYYAEGLLLGIVLYSYLAEATKGSVNSLVLREPLVRKVDFPRLAVPLAVVLTATFNVLLNLLPVLSFLLIDGAPVRATWLELPLLLVALGAFATGIGMLLAPLYVRFRDVDPIWDVVLQVLFYGSPIFYTIETVRQSLAGHEWVVTALMCNPFAVILQQARHALLGPGHMSAAAAIGGGARLLIPLAIAVAVFALGCAVFRRAAPRIAELL